MNIIYKSPTFSTESRDKLNTTYSVMCSLSTTTYRVSDLDNFESTYTIVGSNSARWSDITDHHLNTIPLTASHGITIGPSNSSTLYFTESATVWDDLVTPITLTRVGASAPAFSKWGAGGLFIYKFDANDEVFTSVQMPHSWKSGTIIYPHIHWCQDTGTASPAVGLSAVRWNLEITWAGHSGGLFTPSGTTTYWATADITGPDSQILTNIPTSGVDPTTFAQHASSISSVMMVRLYRGGTGDTYGATPVNGLSFDVHYEKDSIGSENILTKYV